MRRSARVGIQQLLGRSCTSPTHASTVAATPTQAQFGYTCQETYTGLIAWLVYWVYPVLVLMFHMRMLCFRYPAATSVPPLTACASSKRSSKSSAVAARKEPPLPMVQACILREYSGLTFPTSNNEPKRARGFADPCPSFSRHFFFFCSCLRPSGDRTFA